jgi:hypothetical protein
LPADQKIAISQDRIHEFGRKVTLKADDERVRNQLADRFRSVGLPVPAVDEIVDTLKMDRTTARKSFN